MLSNTEKNTGKPALVTHRHLLFVLAGVIITLLILYSKASGGF